MYRILFDSSSGYAEIDVYKDSKEEAEDYFKRTLICSEDFKNTFGNLYRVLRVKEIKKEGGENGCITS